MIKELDFTINNIHWEKVQSEFFKLYVKTVVQKKNKVNNTVIKVENNLAGSLDYITMYRNNFYDSILDGRAMRYLSLNMNFAYSNTRRNIKKK